MKILLLALGKPLFALASTLLVVSPSKVQVKQPEIHVFPNEGKVAPNELKRRIEPAPEADDKNENAVPIPSIKGIDQE